MDWRSQRTCLLAYANNYLIDLKVAIIVDVEATRAIRQAEVGAARTMIERTEERLELCPERLAAEPRRPRLNSNIRLRCNLYCMKLLVG